MKRSNKLEDDLDEGMFILWNYLFSIDSLLDSKQVSEFIYRDERVDHWHMSVWVVKVLTRDKQND